ncbi:rhodanese-like domain-containing protein [Paenibacillaceae bacterium]|nr:rhodanese-like domain-containing protein [Paenibacillaceae bacterium]
MEAWREIDAQSLLSGLENGEIAESQIIDVREQGEWDFYHLENTRHIPMQSIPAHLEQLSEDESLFIVCAHGVRSERVCQYLSGQGWSNLSNVSGGMAALASIRGFQYD